MVANKSISGLGSISGPGNIMGNAGTGYSFNLSTGYIDDNSTMWYFGGTTLTVNNATPAYITSYMPYGQPITLTVSGLTGLESSMNGQQFDVIWTNTQFIPSGTNNTFEDFQYTFGLGGSFAHNHPGFTISWN
jgi:hypothetical protein